MEEHMSFSCRVLTATTFISLFNLQSLSQQKSSEDTLHHSLPKLELIGEKSFDFGDIYRGQKVTHYFTIKNSGDDTLLIKDVSASCGCTAAMASTSVVPPQSTSKLKVTFNSEGYGGRTQKTVTVTSNDPVNPTQQVNISANILVVLESNPSYLYMWRTKVDSVSLSVIKITNVTDKPVSILSTETSLVGLQAEITKKTLKPKETADLRVSYKPAKEGPAYGHVVLKTDFRPQPTVSIRLTANAYK
jgi:hypothetical protein